VIRHPRPLEGNRTLSLAEVAGAVEMHRLLAHRGDLPSADSRIPVADSAVVAESAEQPAHPTPGADRCALELVADMRLQQAPSAEGSHMVIGLEDMRVHRGAETLPVEQLDTRLPAGSGTQAEILQ
jgi:hypothetical protein